MMYRARGRPHRKCRKVPKSEIASLPAEIFSDLDRLSDSGAQRLLSPEASSQKRDHRIKSRLSTLVKRRIDQEHDYNLQFHYTCPVGQVMQETFRVKIKYVDETGLVTFHPVNNVVTFGPVSSHHGLGNGPIDFHGYMFAHNRRHHTDPHTGDGQVCLYKFRAYIEGEVLTSNMNAAVSEPVNWDDYQSIFEPEVTEECFQFDMHRGVSEICALQTEALMCTVHNVYVTLVEE
ncbi:protein of unknown function [Taphrina deformans PYCC 5710]|uniref:Uncharacterized protein n=1 Tax=Taphrina deformans (strain PYCC 5710 / ATCC 11124 / CBS 356.35 / IMI 108563 / JCM 9778 / NBRC 8474) TaxID=1097556 RepID=R4XLM3_TAPDE|nr:protein of unknown function [Taphrina deformans PYCC 5710]|eukprot:CCG84195.1 protein of unknown function [Taphrina deformans PYCC 5710]